MFNMLKKVVDGLFNGVSSVFKFIVGTVGLLFLGAIIIVLIATGVSMSGNDDGNTGDNNNAGDTVAVSDSEKNDQDSSEKEKAVYLSIPELDAKLAEQPAVIVNAGYESNPDYLQSVYSGNLTAIVQNNSEDVWKECSIRIAAWDDSNYPVAVVGAADLFDGNEYVFEGMMDNINLKPGETYGEGRQYWIDRVNTPITTVKAIVSSYTTLDGETWTNPFYDEWEEMYVGKELKDDMKVKAEDNE